MTQSDRLSVAHHSPYRLRHMLVASLAATFSTVPITALIILVAGYVSETPGGIRWLLRLTLYVNVFTLPTALLAAAIATVAIATRANIRKEPIGSLVPAITGLAIGLIAGISWSRALHAAGPDYFLIIGGADGCVAGIVGEHVLRRLAKAC